MSVRTVQFSTADTEALDSLCGACRPRRNRSLTRILGAASIIELVERYMRPGDLYRPGSEAVRGRGTDVEMEASLRDASYARRHAQLLANLEPDAACVLAAVRARRPLPVSAEMLSCLRAAAHAESDTPDTRILARIGAGGILAKASSAPRSRTAQGRWAAENAALLWPHVTAIHLENLTELHAAARSSTGAHASPGAERHPAGAQDRDAYLHLKGLWHEHATLAAQRWLDDLSLTRAGESTREPELVLSSADLNDEEQAEQWGTPTALAVTVYARSGIRLYSMHAAAADLMDARLPAGLTARVGQDSSDTRELGLLALDVAADGRDAHDAVEVARAAWQH